MTHHADKRIRQRVGVPRSAVRRLAIKARNDGTERRDTSGSLRRYLDRVYHYNEAANRIMVWSEKVWIFSDNALITVLNLPLRYRNTANGLTRKTDAD